MKIVIDIPDVPMQDYQDLYYKIYHMAVNEGLFDDRVKSQRALALKAVLDVLDGILKGTPLSKYHTDSIVPYLLHTGLGCPLNECVNAYKKAIEYLRNKSNMKG